MYSDDQQLLVMHLFGLFLRCPFGEPTPNCPFTEIRALRSLDTKFLLAEQMANHPDCRENVNKTHAVCYQERLRQLRGRQDAGCLPPSSSMRPSPPCC